MNTDDEKRNADHDRFALLDRIEERLPEIDLNQHEVEWTKVPDGAEALVIDGGGFDGGSGCFIANAGEDIHVIGVMTPLMPGKVGCIAVRPDGTRELVRVMADPLAEQGDDE